jgi:hypothetical protein
MERERDVLPNLGPYGVPFFSAENENPSSPWYPHEFFSHPGRRESFTSPAAKPIDMWLLGDWDGISNQGRLGCAEERGERTLFGLY